MNNIYTWMINEVASTKTTVIDNDTREKKILSRWKYYQDENIIKMKKKEQTMMKYKKPEENWGKISHGYIYDNVEDDQIWLS
jgi:hypothetical protein